MTVSARNAAQMRQQHERSTWLQRQIEMVASDRGDTGPDPSCLAERIRHKRQVRAPGLMVWFSVVGDDHTTPTLVV